LVRVEEFPEQFSTFSPSKRVRNEVDLKGEGWGGAIGGEEVRLGLGSGGASEEEEERRARRP
jgi:hypothetical protein